MWRMRMRLLTGYLVLLALGHLPEHGALGQKYYMNFAFNNNNPDGEGGTGADGGAAGGGPAGAGGATSDRSQEGDGSAATDRPNDDHATSADNSLATDGDAGDKKSSGDGKSDSDSDSKDSSGGNAATPANGHDDDNDDSDSKDVKDRHSKEDAAAEGKRTDHSHHSSYEISIDDSFGGRYVRSIYESSESHGHSGSNAGSNQRDSGARDSSQETQTAKEMASEAPAARAPRVAGNVPDGPETGAKEDDYEEM
ncbi:accessory gland protein Acp32CD [Drosophila yakuba]|uniref:Uncharacterized protein, isoform A n=1 Tax=Drosophila yakuba TaxID=7245 RepID=B4P159_DROYA|nr:accessory gland protein Acp32CD [Drosophila yakuba]XP_015053637.1 accessory gland protein Acp32CD [Drosophila yakuba]EDW88034.1 uncharacterized protein Dyak_GE18506, isoform A [Drosophila yakuba]KRJ97533.1 uncharacterized protein Dyak_GE18506, isoform B [Drosophila yakuba]